jgi:hypothetical protein
MSGLIDVFSHILDETKPFKNCDAGQTCPVLAFFQDPAGQRTAAKSSPLISSWHTVVRMPGMAWALDCRQVIEKT